MAVSNISRGRHR